MAMTNSPQGYGWMAIVLHWSVALTIFGLFGVGLYMTGLDYYDPWYTKAPWLHKSVGMLLVALMAFRLVWRLLNSKPAPEPGQKPWETKIAELTHRVLYTLVFMIFASGFLISTADGRGISVFDLFTVPALFDGVPNQEDIAGEVHYWLAWALMGLVALHAAAALKHHFIDKDNTMKRMLRSSR